MTIAADDFDKLKLIHDATGGEFCAGLMAQLFKSKTVADLATTGKVTLSDTKREQVVSYIISVLADAGGMFIPTGTLGKALNHIMGAVTVHGRKKRFGLFSQTTANPTHFALIVQALVNSLLISHGNRLWFSLSEKDASDKGEALGKKIVNRIKKDEVPTEHWGSKNLPDMTKGFYQLAQQVINEEASVASTSQSSDTVLPYEEILLIAAAQLLGLPETHFAQSASWEEPLKTLEDKVEELKKTLASQTDTKGALLAFLGKTNIEGKVTAKHVGYKFKVKGSAKGIGELDESGVLGKYAAKEKEADTKLELKTLILFKGPTKIAAQAKVKGERVDTTNEFVLS